MTDHTENGKKFYYSKHSRGDNQPPASDFAVEQYCSICHQKTAPVPQEWELINSFGANNQI